MDRKILINDLMVRREVLIPEDISHGGKFEFAHFRLDHIDAVLAERKDLIAEVERLTGEVAATYEKGAQDMKLRCRLAMCEADTPFRSYDEVWQIAQERVLALPLREVAEAVRG